MFGYIIDYFFGSSSNDNNVIDESIEFDKLSRDEILDILKQHKYCNLDYSKMKDLSKVEIYHDDLVSYSYHLYNQMQKILGKYNSELTQSSTSTTKRKFYIKPTFSKEVFDNSIDETNIVPTVNDKFLDYVINDPRVEYNNGKITLNEYNTAYKKGTSKTDFFGIEKNILGDLPDFIKLQIIGIYNEILENGENDFNHNIGRGNFAYKAAKKGKLDDVKSFRQLVAIPNIVNMFHRIMALRISNYFIENSYLDTAMQKGGIHGIKHGVLEQIIKMKSIIKYANKTKKSLSATFIDVSDAFPSLNIDKLTRVLAKYKVPNNISTYIRKYYTNFTYYASVKEWKSKNIKWNRGLIQGCPMSPVLFTVVLNYILKYLEQKYNDYGFMFNMNRVTFLAYMDDIVVLCNDPVKSNVIYQELESIFADFGMIINKDKTAQMNINCINNQPLVSVVQSYKYLGEIIWSNGSSYNHIKHILGYVKQKVSWLEKSTISEENKQKYVSSIMIPSIHRKMVTLTDITPNENLKLLKIIDETISKFKSADVDIYKQFDLLSFVNTSTDPIIKNIDIINVPTANINKLLDTDSIKFNYDNNENCVIEGVNLNTNEVHVENEVDLDDDQKYQNDPLLDDQVNQVVDLL